VVPKNTEEMDTALINAWETFHRYAVGEVWDNKWDLRSSIKIIHTIKFCKAISVRECHMSSSPEEWVFRSSILQWQIFRIN
jgi:hypothetical protein